MQQQRMKTLLIAAGWAALGAAIHAGYRHFTSDIPTPVIGIANTSLSSAGCKTLLVDALDSLGGTTSNRHTDSVTGQIGGHELTFSCLENHGIAQASATGEDTEESKAYVNDALKVYRDLEAKLPSDSPLMASSNGLTLDWRRVPLGDKRRDCLRVARAAVDAMKAKELGGTEAYLRTNLSGQVMDLICLPGSRELLVVSPRRTGASSETVLESLAAQVEAASAELEPAPSKQFNDDLRVVEAGLRGKFSTQVCMSAARNALKNAGRVPFTDTWRLTTNKDGIWVSVSCLHNGSTQLLAISTEATTTGKAADDALNEVREEMRARLPL